MKQKYSDLSAVIRKYVLNQLSEEESEEFEEYFLSIPEVVSEIETMQNIVIGMENVEKTFLYEFSGESTLQKESNLTHSLKALISKLITVKVPVYSFVLIAALATFFGRSLLVSNSLESNAEYIYFTSGVTRSGSVEATENSSTINLGSVTKVARLDIKLAQVAYPQYQLELSTLDTKTKVWQSKPQSAGNVRDLHFEIPKHLDRSKYFIRVIGTDGKIDGTAVKFCHLSQVCN